MIHWFFPQVIGNQFLSYQTSMIFSTQIIRISWCHSLQIYNVTPLICTPNTLYLHTPRNFYRLTLSIKYFIHLYTHFPRNLFHQCMKLIIWLNCFLLVHSSILCQTRKFRVVQNTRNDTLSNDSMPSIIDDCCCNIMESIYFKGLQLSQTRKVVIGLGPRRILFGWSQILEWIIRINGKGEENEVVHEDLLFLLLCRIQRRNTAFHNCNCSFSCSIQKVIVYFGYSSVSLSALGHILFWKVFDDLIFFIPISDTLWIESK